MIRSALHTLALVALPVLADAPAPSAARAHVMRPHVLASPPLWPGRQLEGKWALYRIAIDVDR
jgi:hypothetical protein